MIGPHPPPIACPIVRHDTEELVYYVVPLGWRLSDAGVKELRRIFAERKQEGTGEQLVSQPRTIRQRFLLTIEATDSEIPVPVRLRRFLKSALRSYGLRCTRAVEDCPDQAEQLAQAREEIRRLQAMIEGMVERIARQSELLARNAERNTLKGRK